MLVFPEWNYLAYINDIASYPSLWTKVCIFEKIYKLYRVCILKQHDQSVIYDSLSAYQLTLCDQVFHLNIGGSWESGL